MQAENQPRLEPPGFFELVYGILFDPVKTFGRIAGKPPLGSVFIVFTLVRLLSTLVGGYILLEFMSGSLADIYGLNPGDRLRLVIPLLALGALIFAYLKWFFYSGLLHLVGEFFGGRGSSVGVLSVTGLASLPALLFLPFRILAAVFGGSKVYDITSFIIWLVVLVWGVILVVIGLMETQRLSAERAVATVFAPVIGMVALGVFILFIVAFIIIPLSVAPMAKMMGQ
ncbi:MAG: YIP1 family protein [Bacillota bacterium]